MTIEFDFQTKTDYQKLEVKISNEGLQTFMKNPQYLNHFIDRAITNASPAMYGRILKLKLDSALPQSLCFLIAAKVAHLYGVVAVYDLELWSYVIAISRFPQFKQGSVLLMDDDENNIYLEEDLEIV